MTQFGLLKLSKPIRSAAVIVLGPAPKSPQTEESESESITLNSLILAYRFSLSRTVPAAPEDHDSAALARTLTPQEVIASCYRGRPVCVFFPLSKPSLEGSSLSSGWNRSCVTPLGHSRLVCTDCSKCGGWEDYAYTSKHLGAHSCEDEIVHFGTLMRRG